MEIVWFCLLGFICFIIFSYVRLYLKYGKHIKCNCKVNMIGKTVLITGGTRGIGLETAVSLAGMGARVIIASSNPYMGQAAVREIRERSRNDNVSHYELHLDDFTSVRSTAENILYNECGLDVLINNAGIAYHPKAKAKNGCDKIFATNYLGHFLFTYLLIQLLRRSAPSRIVNVSSVGHRFARTKLDFSIQNDMYGSELFPHLSGYDTSKLALILFTKELARRISAVGITTNVVHPGVATNTRIWTDMTQVWPKVTSWMYRLLVWPLSQGVVSSAQTVIHAAVSPELEGISGKYLERCQIVPCKNILNEERDAACLWNASMLLTGCTINGGVVPKLTFENEHENNFDSDGSFEYLIKVTSGKKKPLKVPEFNTIDRECYSKKKIQFGFFSY